MALGGGRQRANNRRKEDKRQTLGCGSQAVDTRLQSHEATEVHLQRGDSLRGGRSRRGGTRRGLAVARFARREAALLLKLVRVRLTSSLRLLHGVSQLLERLVAGLCVEHLLELISALFSLRALRFELLLQLLDHLLLRRHLQKTTAGRASEERRAQEAERRNSEGETTNTYIPAMSRVHELPQPG